MGKQVTVALTEATMKHLVRIYHSAADAATAMGVLHSSINHAAKRYHLKFRSASRRLTFPGPSITINKTKKAPRRCD